MNTGMQEYRNTCKKNAGTQEYRNSRTQELKNTRTLLAVGHKHLADGIAGGDDCKTRIQVCRYVGMHVKRTQELKNTGTQEHRNSGTQGLKNTRTLLAVGYKHLADEIAGGDDF
jgi:hypothetical protein